MITTLADQYLAQNAGRRYPFKDDTELPDWLPDSGVLDFRCTLYGVGAGTAPEARLVNVAHTGDGDVRFTVDLSAGGVVVDTIRFLVPSDMSGEPYTAYASGDRSTGSLTVTAAAIPPSTEAPPYDSEVEYLESTGAQWIDTGVPYDSSVACECVMAKTSNTISGSYIFGILWASGASSTVRRWAVVYNGNANKLLPQYATTMNVANPTLLQNGVIYKLQANSTTFAVDNTFVNVTSTTFDPTTDVSIYIFARHTYAPQLDPNPVTGKQAFRLYSFKVTKGGMLVRDFQPVRFTNEHGQSEGAMYDRVSGQLFRNANTAAGAAPFRYGNDVAPAPGAGEYPVDIPLAATTVVCDSLKVMSLQSAQGANDARDDDDPATRTVTTAVSGDIEIAEGRNTEPYLDGNRLRLDIVKGGGLGERCQSAVMGGQRCDTVLFTINGERPGSDGELRIAGDDGITVTPIPDEHAIEIRMDEAAAGRMTDGCAPACSEA